jgi:energy-coupling factor transporter ATP-binding protein EcfA2
VTELLNFGLKSLTLASGESIDLDTEGLTIIVGPNNAGKSQLLRDMNLALQDRAQKSVWQIDFSVQINPDQEVSSSWFNSKARPMLRNDVYPPVIDTLIASDDMNQMVGYGLILNETNVVQILQSAPQNGLNTLYSWFVLYLGAWERLQSSQDAQRRNPAREALLPLHRIWDDVNLEARMSGLVREAFDIPVSINRFADQIRLLVGEPAGEISMPPPRDVIAELSSRLSLWDSTGDGIRSFVGILLNIIAGDKQVLIVDEPEAFLHPPQARLLGRHIVEHASIELQTICATHSPDFLQGALDAAQLREVTILRVFVEPDGSRSLRALPAAKVNTLWNDQVLRFSHALDGLFHHGLVLCEGDSDARVYEATFESMSRASALRPIDLVWTHVGGKGRIPRLFGDMREFGVRVAAIVDIDVLSNAGDVRRLIEAAGGDFSLVKSDLDLVDREVAGSASGVTVQGLRDGVTAILRRPKTSRLSDEELGQLRELATVRSGWKTVKRGGVNMIIDRRVEVERVIAYLSTLGIFVVSVGELERFFPVAVGKGAFSAEVLSARLFEIPPAELRLMMENLRSYLSPAVTAADRVEQHGSDAGRAG